MKKFIFPDTNIFLHFRPLDEFDFVQMLDCETVELVVTPIVVKELDEKKWNSYEGIGQRAEASLRRIEKWDTQDNVMRPGVSLSLETSGPSEEYLVNHNLNQLDQDAQLLACALMYLDLHGSENVFLLTADTGQRLRAKRFGLSTLWPPTKFQLEPARNPLKEENLRLSRQLAEYQGRSSELKLLFANQIETVHFSFRPHLQSPPQEMIDEMHQMVNNVHENADKYFKVIWEREKKERASSSPFRQVLSASKPIPEKVEKYRHDVETYEQRYEQFLSHWLEVANRFMRTMELNLELHNLGTAMAEAVLLILEIPDKLEWCELPTEDEIPSPPLSPSQPQWWGGLGNYTDYMTSFPAIGEIPGLYDLSPIGSHFETFSKDPEIEGNKVRWELGDCRHNDMLKLGPMYARFKKPDEVSSFQIDYTVHEKNTPQPKKGRLLVKQNEFEGKE